MIQKLDKSSSHINRIMEIIPAVVAHLRSQGIDQWDEIYPDKAIIEDDMEQMTAFGYFDNGRLVAYFCLNESCDPEYDDIRWQVSTGTPLYVHRLMVDPSEQGKGIAKRCMQHAEQHAREEGYSALRFDTFTKNPASCRLYQSMGYPILGTIELRMGVFNCYEKALTETIK